MAERKIVLSLSDLPNVEAMHGDSRMVIDIESTSMADDVEGFQPFLGHRIAGVGIMAKTGDGWYLPLRHAPFDEQPNLPYDGAIAFLKDVAKQPREWIGHNIKFDCRFLYQDGINLDGTLSCTVVLARLVDSMLLSAKMNYLAKKWLPQEHWKDDKEVQRELKARKTKDYGRIPTDICGRYCLQDCDTTWRLYDMLIEKLPAESKRLWTIEQNTTRMLLNSELHGIYVPRRNLAKYTHEHAKKLVELQEKINGICNQDVDILSNEQLTHTLEKMAVKPTSFTENGRPSWDAETLRTYGIPLTDALADYKETYSAFSNYGEGWMKRLTNKETLHPNYRQAGTKTGRLSSEDPNFQNLNLDAKRQVFPRPGHKLLAIDYSQIEFRLFAHYTNSPGIIEQYKNNPMTDYHQGTADMLGIPRKPAKTTNFGMIYGMGREKLQNQITAFIREAIRKGDAKVLEALRAFNYGEAVTENNAHHVSAVVYNVYHRKFPEIREFGRRVTNVIQSRGWAKGLYGRIYSPPPEFAHKLRNWLIQGSAADLFKDRASAVAVELPRFNAHLLCNVHDEVLIETPDEAVHECVKYIVPILENPSVELRVPIKVEVCICDGCWGEKKPYVMPA
jgi:DNA polymerase-1